jgi:hypothetical protein
LIPTEPGRWRQPRSLAASRRYGGIHFREGDLTGQAIGREVGARAWEAASALFAGRAGGTPT